MLKYVICRGLMQKENFEKLGFSEQGYTATRAQSVEGRKESKSQYIHNYEIC